jgi:UPF0755 protein
MEVSIAHEATVFVPRNASIVAAIDSANAHCPMPTPWLVKLVARVRTRLSPLPIQSGWYVFRMGDSQLDVLEALLTGRLRPSVRVTLREGLTSWETAHILARELEIDSAELEGACDSLEGYLFPNTYQFFWREESAVVVKRLVDEFHTQLGDSLPSREELVLASIVQSEAAQESEMPRIAGVYVNRLRKGMKLEADPTVQYGLRMRARVLYEHLATDHPWNTYLHTGLPPTPIGNPGLAAIRAAMHPERHDYLFFVARGDGSGLHRFAKTFGEHLKNVQLYRKARLQAVPST